MTGSKSHPTISHKSRSHPMPGNRRQHGVPADLRIKMGMQINKSWGHQLTFGIQFFTATAKCIPYFNNSLTRYCYIRLKRLSTSPVQNGSIPNDYIVHSYSPHFHLIDNQVSPNESCCLIYYAERPYHVMPSIPAQITDRKLKWILF